MKHHFSKIFAAIFILAMVLSACSPAEPAKSTEVPVTAAPKATDAPKVDLKPSATAAPSTPKNAVTSLEGVQNATIQIEAQGTFLDPR